MNINTAPQEIQMSQLASSHGSGRTSENQRSLRMEKRKDGKKKPSRFRKKYIKMAPSIPFVWDWCLLIGGLLVDLAGKNWAYKGSTDSPGWWVDWKRDMKGNPRF